MSTIKLENIQHPDSSSPAISLDSAGGLFLAGGKILQIVRATDATQRTTTSTSFVDAGISVTITPQKNTSAILLVWSFMGDNADAGRTLLATITDSDNNSISGAEFIILRVDGGRGLLNMIGIAYATPATTSAITYKGRFRTEGGEIRIQNQDTTGQLYAIEVSA